jgi:hypothetical protein
MKSEELKIKRSRKEEGGTPTQIQLQQLLAFHQAFASRGGAEELATGLQM